MFREYPWALVQHIFCVPSSSVNMVATLSSFLVSVALSAVVLASPTPFPTSNDITNLNIAIPPPPKPEPVSVTEVPLPPVAPDGVGTCTPLLNARGTGCIIKGVGAFQGGGFLPDGNHLLAHVNYTGAPAAPDPASIYSGENIIAIKVDGTTFANGDAWKCLTCGIPAANIAGRATALDYPQAFRDGKKLLIGSNILSCEGHLVASQECTPERTHIHAIRWDIGTEAPGSIRELRIHPDDNHLGFSSVAVQNGKMNQYGYLGRLQYNSAPTSGLPTAPRYDLVNVTTLFNAADAQPLYVNPKNPRELLINNSAITIGELRGFNGVGDKVTYVGYPVESCNIDVFAAHLVTGKVERLTNHYEYADPIDFSPDGEWFVVQDTRFSNRNTFMSGMQGIPPILDQISTTVCSSVRNNGQRRFFQPWLIDRYGDRGDYFGQKLNAAGDGSPGSINDPEWNGMADPRWSLDGTKVTYWQSLTIPPQCGGANPLPCRPSTYQGGREGRILVAHLTSRRPKPPAPVKTVPEPVPWGTPYTPGSPAPKRPYIPGGDYTLSAKVSGSAHVVIRENAAGTGISNISVSYNNFFDGTRLLRGWENFTATSTTPTLNKIDWFSNLTQIGKDYIIRNTSVDGFHLTIDSLVNIFSANGTLSTTSNGRTYTQPLNNA
jgi:hypothetical protein